MEAILTIFGSVSSVKSAAEVPLNVGDLCVYVSPQSGQTLGGRVKWIHAEAGLILFRETYPLRQMPAEWEPAQFMADPKNIFPAM